MLEEQENALCDFCGADPGIEKGLLLGRLEGEQSGIAKGESLHCPSVAKRFGPLSDDVLARLQAASIDELELRG